MSGRKFSKHVVKTQPALAEALGMSVSWTRDKIALGMPGKEGCWIVEDCQSWLKLFNRVKDLEKENTDLRTRIAAKPVGMLDTDAVVENGANSPALERLRTIKGDIEEIKLSQLRHETISLEVLKAVYGRWAQRFRGLGEMCAKLSTGMADEFDGVLALCADDLESVLNEHAGGGGDVPSGNAQPVASSEGTATANDAEIR